MINGVLIVLCNQHCISSFKIHYGQTASNKRERMRVQAIHMLVQLLGYFHVSWLHWKTVKTYLKTYG